MKCNLALSLREEQLMLCLSCEGSMKKSVMLKEKSCLCVLWTWTMLLTEYRGKC